ncbi:Vps23 core domain-containing protein [Phycomyces blakesleeanus]
MLLDIRERLKNNIRVISTKTVELDEAISTANTMPDVSMDESIYGTTVVYNQMFDLVADDNAVVDTIYYLSKALNSECIDLATFMKCTRSLAREQFMKRALLKKITEA